MTSKLLKKSTLYIQTLGLTFDKKCVLNCNFFVLPPVMFKTSKFWIFGIKLIRHIGRAIRHMWWVGWTPLLKSKSYRNKELTPGLVATTL